MDDFRIFSGKDDAWNPSLTKLISKLNHFNCTKKLHMKGRVSLHHLREAKHEFTIVIMKKVTTKSQIINKRTVGFSLEPIPSQGKPNHLQNFGIIKGMEVNFERLNNREATNGGIGNLLSAITNGRDIKFDQVQGLHPMKFGILEAQVFSGRSNIIEDINNDDLNNDLTLLAPNFVADLQSLKNIKRL